MKITVKERAVPVVDHIDLEKNKGKEELKNYLL